MARARNLVLHATLHHAIHLLRAAPFNNKNYRKSRDSYLRETLGYVPIILLSRAWSIHYSTRMRQQAVRMEVKEARRRRQRSKSPRCSKEFSRSARLTCIPRDKKPSRNSDSTFDLNIPFNIYFDILKPF